MPRHAKHWPQIYPPLILGIVVAAIHFFDRDALVQLRCCNNDA